MFDLFLSLLITVGVSVVVTILSLGIIRGMYARGYDPIGRVGRFFAPRAPSNGANGNGSNGNGAPAPDAA